MEEEETNAEDAGSAPQTVTNISELTLQNPPSSQSSLTYKEACVLLCQRLTDIKFRGNER